MCYTTSEISYIIHILREFGHLNWTAMSVTFFALQLVIYFSITNFLMIVSEDVVKERK
jgi:hypothetical protein